MLASDHHHLHLNKKPSKKKNGGFKLKNKWDRDTNVLQELSVVHNRTCILMEIASTFYTFFVTNRIIYHFGIPEDIVCFKS